MKLSIFASSAIATSLLLAPTPGFSMGSDTPTTTPTCKIGYIYSKKKKKCVRKKSQIFPDSDLKQQGWKLAYSGQYKAAIELFEMVADKADPEALNGLGYSNRKSGRFNIGIAYYKQALTIKPDYVLAREYLGEGYVAAGRINLAKLQLAKIKQYCGTNCTEYTRLAQVITTGNSANW